MPSSRVEAKNLADLVASAARRGPDHPALIEAVSGLEVSWGSLDAAVNREAKRLRAAGLLVGERVALRMGNCAAFCITLFGVLRAGGVVVPLSPKLPAAELGRILTESGARLLVTEEEPSGGRPPEGVRPLAAAEAGEGTDEPPVEPVTRGEDLALISYTSSTSGEPRGAMLSHRALLANVRQLGRLRPMPVNAADRALLGLPLFHLYGLGPGLLQVAAVGATAVLLPRFEPEESLDAIVRYRSTTVIGVPPMYEAWLQLTGERLREDMATVRLLHSGAAPLGEVVAHAVRAATGLDVFEGYGLVEAGPVLTTSLAGGQAKPGSPGKPLPGVQLRVLDEQGHPLADSAGATGTSHIGRIVARGENLFSGYWPDGRAGPHAEGWMSTGDFGYLDDDGDLHVIARETDLIRVGREHVYPHEVEEVLLEIPGVLDAAVVGAPDGVRNGFIKAMLVVAAGAGLTGSGVREHCRARLADFKVPASVEFVPELPYSATGKLARRVLRR